VRERRPDAHFLLKHQADDLPKSVRASIERLGLEGAITMLANLPFERMPDVYRAADVVLSIPSTDSSPRSVWEALACGRPVVVSDLPWAREEFEDGKHAILAPLEAGSVADALGRALGDERLGLEGRLLAQRELDRDACTARINDLYQSVAERPARRTTSR